MKSPVDLSTLQKMYFENERRFKLGGTRMFDTNLETVSNITEFFYKYNYEDFMNAKLGAGYVSWDTNSVPSSQAIRKVFPRPTFVMSHSEVSLLKRVYIEGPLAAEHELVSTLVSITLRHALLNVSRVSLAIRQVQSLPCYPIST